MLAFLSICFLCAIVHCTVCAILAYTKSEMRSYAWAAFTFVLAFFATLYLHVSEVAI